MAFNLEHAELTIYHIIGNSTPIVKGVSPWTDFETKKPLGWKYDILILEKGIRFTAKVRETEPSVSSEEITTAASPYIVTDFEGEMMTLYGSDLRNVNITFTADGITLEKQG